MWEMKDWNDFFEEWGKVSLRHTAADRDHYIGMSKHLSAKFVAECGGDAKKL
jgi:hypothetical protein